MLCDICKIEETMPFKCRYCNGTFCGHHRLPPNHDCPFLEDFVKQPARHREYIERIQGKRGAPQERVAAVLKNAVILRFSGVELLHLIIGTALVTAVGLSFYNFTFRLDFLTVFVSAFIVHELAHKFLAQIYHAWAEFRLILYGAAITALSAVPLFPFKFIAPGAVFIGGPLSERRHGRVAWIGPLTNLVMGTGFLASYLSIAVWYSSSVGFGIITPQILLVGARFNAWIALFNLIPFMGLDGQKIFSWNKLMWVLTMAAAAMLFIGSDMIGGGGVIRYFRRGF